MVIRTLTEQELKTVSGGGEQQVPGALGPGVLIGDAQPLDPGVLIGDSQALDPGVLIGD